MTLIRFRNPLPLVAAIQEAAHDVPPFVPSIEHALLTLSRLPVTAQVAVYNVLKDRFEPVYTGRTS
jgi:hypothetical protein